MFSLLGRDHVRIAHPDRRLPTPANHLLAAEPSVLICPRHKLCLTPPHHNRETMGSRPRTNFRAQQAAGADAWAQRGGHPNNGPQNNGGGFFSGWGGGGGGGPQHQQQWGGGGGGYDDGAQQAPGVGNNPWGPFANIRLTPTTIAKLFARYASCLLPRKCAVMMTLDESVSSFCSAAC